MTIFDNHLLILKIFYDAASAGDVLAPSRIHDLEVTKVEQGRVELKWTAPGDDLDHGTGK